jgi:hypothetical protein
VVRADERSSARAGGLSDGTAGETVSPRMRARIAAQLDMATPTRARALMK